MAWVEYERGRVKHIINTLKRLLKQLPDYETYHIEAEMGIEGEKFSDGDYLMDWIQEFQDNIDAPEFEEDWVIEVLEYAKVLRSKLNLNWQ